MIAALPLALALFLQAPFTARCVAVLDGDTIEVLREGWRTRIRLEGIDCPERGQPFSRRAKQFTSGLVFGRDVDVRPKGLDRYGRTVARVRVGAQDLSVDSSGRGWPGTSRGIPPIRSWRPGRDGHGPRNVGSGCVREPLLLGSTGPAIERTPDRMAPVGEPGLPARAGSRLPSCASGAAGSPCRRRLRSSPRGGLGLQLCRSATIRAAAAAGLSDRCRAGPRFR
jgi:hypothetical protein